MAKTENFFIRAIVDADNDAVYAETEIDLGAFVDALGSTILTVKSISVQYTDNSNVLDLPNTTGANQSANCMWQLTTQSQTGIITADNKSVIGSGRIIVVRSAGVGVASIDDTLDVNPSNWADGYNVATESIFLGASTALLMVDGMNIAIVLECLSRKMTPAAAMALALSQQ